MRELMDSLSIRDVMVSFSYCRAYATATAIALRQKSE